MSWWQWASSQGLCGFLSASGHAALAQMCFPHSVPSLDLYLQATHRCAGKEEGEDAILYRGIKPCAFTPSRWHFVFAVWPSHRSCVCLILTSALCRKRRWTGRSKQSKLMLLEGTWAHPGFETSSVAARAPPALLLCLNVGNRSHLDLL